MTIQDDQTFPGRPSLHWDEAAHWRSGRKWWSWPMVWPSAAFNPIVTCSSPFYLCVKPTSCRLPCASCPWTSSYNIPGTNSVPQMPQPRKRATIYRAHDGARNSSWPTSKGITRCGILYHARVENTTIRGKVQCDGWPSRQIGEDPELHATRLREYLSRTLTASKKFWPPQPLKTHGQQFLGQV